MLGWHLLLRAGNVHFGLQDRRRLDTLILNWELWLDAHQLWLANPPRRTSEQQLTVLQRHSRCTATYSRANRSGQRAIGRHDVHNVGLPLMHDGLRIADGHDLSPSRLIDSEHGLRPGRRHVNRVRGHRLTRPTHHSYRHHGAIPRLHADALLSASVLCVHDDTVRMPHLLML